MITKFSTGPGFYAAQTNEGNPKIPKGTIRLYVARIEAYDGPAALGDDMDKVEFTVLPAMAENNPEVAMALIQLHSALSGNLDQLKIEAAK